MDVAKATVKITDEKERRAKRRNRNSMASRPSGEHQGLFLEPLSAMLTTLNSGVIRLISGRENNFKLMIFSLINDFFFN